MRTFTSLVVNKKVVGSFDISESCDEEYPGLDIELILNDDEVFDHASRPRVVFEYNEEMGLRMLIWADKDSEDYTDEIVFDTETKRIKEILKKEGD